MNFHSGGTNKAFGVGNGQLTAPKMKKQPSMTHMQIPIDDREAEVLYASIAVLSGILYIALQVDPMAI